MDFRSWLYLEMPLATMRHDFAFHGGGKNSFDNSDQVVVSHPKTAQTLERVLSKTGYRFNILMLSSGREEEDEYGGTPDWYTTKVHEFMRQQNIPILGHITFVKNGSSGEPLTPWMILHTLGHALSDTDDNLTREMNKEMGEMFKKHFVSHGGAYPTYNTSALMNATYYFMGRLLQFRSARNLLKPESTQRNLGPEIINELIAEYLWHGKIRMSLANAGETLNYSHDQSNSNPTRIAELPIKLLAQDLDYTSAKLERIISAALGRQVGEIIYDYFVDNTKK